MPVIACGATLALLCAFVPVEQCCSEVHLPISYEEAFEIQNLESERARLPEEDLLPSQLEFEDDSDEDEDEFATTMRTAEEASTTWNALSRWFRNMFCASCIHQTVKTAGPFELAVGSGVAITLVLSMSRSFRGNNHVKIS
jgi:hypothetical protein